MLTQGKNKVTIVGILSEINLEHDTYNNDERIRGNVVVQVSQTVNGKEVVEQIPVYVYAQKHKKNSPTELNPSYTNLDAVMKDYKSIALTGDVNTADKVRLDQNTTSISMNEFYGRDGRLVSYPRIRGSFINKVVGEFKPQASFELDFMVSSVDRAFDRNGNEIEPAKLNIKAIVPQYNGSVEIVPLVATNPKAVEVLETGWIKGGCYSCTGRLNFTTETVTTVKEQDFGEPIIESSTTSVSELLVTGGTVEDNGRWDPSEVAQAIQAYKAKLEQSKTKPDTKKAPARGSVPFDLGF